MRDPSVETRLLEPARRLHDGYPDSPFAPHRLATLRRSFGLFIHYSPFTIHYSSFTIYYSGFPFLPICNLKFAMLSLRLSSLRTPPRR